MVPEMWPALLGLADWLLPATRLPIARAFLKVYVRGACGVEAAAGVVAQRVLEEIHLTARHDQPLELMAVTRIAHQPIDSRLGHERLETRLWAKRRKIPLNEQAYNPLITRIVSLCVPLPAHGTRQEQANHQNQ